MAGSPPNLHKMDSRSACIQDVFKVKVKVKGHVICVLFWILGMSYSIIDGLVFTLNYNPNRPIRLMHSFRINRIKASACKTAPTKQELIRQSLSQNVNILVENWLIKMSKIDNEKWATLRKTTTNRKGKIITCIPTHSNHKLPISVTSLSVIHLQSVLKIIYNDLFCHRL